MAKIIFRRSTLSLIGACAVFLASTKAVSAAPSVTDPIAMPSSVLVGVSTPVRFTTRIVDPTLIANSVNLQQLDSTGRVLRIIGTMRDDGTQGDVVANDGTFTLLITLTPTTNESIVVRASAAFRGILLRVNSQSATVTVASSAEQATLAGADMSVANQLTHPSTGARILCNEIYVFLKPDADIADFETFLVSVGAVIAGQSSALKLVQVRVRCSANPSDLILLVSTLNKHPSVNYATPVVIQDLSLVPNDSFFDEQWALDKIRAVEAWDKVTGSDSVTIGIVDTGADKDHEDLAGKVSLGPQLPGAGDPSTDSEGHGTGVSAAAAAATNNNKGVAGAGWQSKLRIEKAWDDTKEQFNQPALIDGILDAIQAGVRVVNLSFGVTEPGNANSNRENVLGITMWDDVLELANKQGVLVVAAAGNENCSLMNNSPANSDYALAVAATGRDDTRALFRDPAVQCKTNNGSSHGTWVDVAAPGLGVLTATRLGFLSRVWRNLGGHCKIFQPYCEVSGTSLAAPIVSGVAALLFAENPSWTATEARLALQLSNATVAPSGLGWSRVDAARAVTARLILKDDFEAGGNAWQTTGFWHRRVDPEKIAVSAQINPALVTLPDGGRLPKAFSGRTAYWYGEGSTGTFIGSDYTSVAQLPKNGGRSRQTNSGNLVSPVIDLSGYSRAGLAFQAWWEVETVDNDRFDVMTVEVAEENQAAFKELARLNPQVDVSGPQAVSFTSGGFNESAGRSLVGRWRPTYVDLSAYAGKRIRVRLRFNTVDNQYNGFRGWFVDDFTVVGVP